MSAYIIAEAGTGHIGQDTLPPKGDFRLACKLVDWAKRAGADAVKFQMFIRDEPLFCPIEGDENRVPRWNNSAMQFWEWETVKNYCGNKEIDFLASVFQPTGIEWLKKLEPKYYKVASRAAKTYPYDQVPGPFIISNGFDLLGRHEYPEQEHYALYCVSEYPTPLNRAEWGASYDGLSDHSGTPWPAIDAIARGVEFVEVHFGDKEGPDGPVNLTTDELKLICEFRDAVAEMRGS